MNKITRQMVIDTKQLLQLGVKQSDIARLVGIGTGTVSEIKTGKYDFLLEDKLNSSVLGGDNEELMQQITALTDMIRDGFKMLHVDIRNQIDTMEKYLEA